MSLVVSIRNISALADVSDYEYFVLVGDGTRANSLEIASGKVSRHRRADGWKALVQRVLDESK